MKRSSITRRTFIGFGSAAVLAAARSRAQTPSPNEKLNIAIIGPGAQGRYDMGEVLKRGHNVVALCDVDRTMIDRALEHAPNAKRYGDYRELFDKQADVDGVVVATPDHHHYFASKAAIEAGKHVYCEKPLTHSINEAHELARLARKAGVATQMGNTGQASPGVRQITEMIDAGAIGPVREVHVWTNRPIWPQGIQRPEQVDPVPESLDWDGWLGPAPERPFNDIYHPFRWRGWWDFGTGALGDIACHRFHGVFKALDIMHPASVEASSSRVYKDTYPLASIVRYQFLARGERPPVKLTWYDGGLKPARPKIYEHDREWKDEGIMFVGDDGVILDGRLVPEARMEAYEMPPERLPRSIGHWEEWFEACKGGPTPGSNFDFAGPLTETVLLGNIALRTGEKLEWDANARKIANVPEANGLMQREYRPGWKL